MFFAVRLVAAILSGAKAVMMFVCFEAAKGQRRLGEVWRRNKGCALLTMKTR